MDLHMLWPDGSPSGACAPACPGTTPHLICSIKRAMAESTCSICGKKIGHDELFVIDKPIDYITHFVCADKVAATP